jgi:hypothetical protein
MPGHADDEPSRPSPHGRAGDSAASAPPSAPHAWWPCRSRASAPDLVCPLRARPILEAVRQLRPRYPGAADPSTTDLDLTDAILRRNPNLGDSGKHLAREIERVVRDYLQEQTQRRR